MKMSMNKRSKHLRQRGQASVEYSIVSILAVIVLLIPDTDGQLLLVTLAEVIKRNYTAFVYAISYSSNFTFF
jgi:uncharacterized protein (UPF0333 family)